MKNTYEGIAREGKNEVLFKNDHNEIVIGGAWLRKDTGITVEKIVRNKAGVIGIHWTTVLI